MWQFMTVTFALLGVAFFHLSGGSDYAPTEDSLQAQQYKVFLAPEKITADPVEEVSRTSVDLNTLPIAVSIQAKAADMSETAFDTTPKPAVIKAVAIETLAQINQTVATVETPAEPEIAEPEKEVRYVSGNGVNLRLGPSTRYNVIDQLYRGEEVTVLQDPGLGWVKLRREDGGRVGWAASYLVADVAK